MKNVLIIGGCGYVGSQLFSYLKANSYNTTSVDLELFNNPNIPNIKENFNNLSIDFLSQFTDIILLAGHSSVKMCESNMIGCFKNNVDYFVNLLPKISKNQKLIYASSSSVYGNINRNIVDEECQEYLAGSFYDLSKSEIDHYARLFNDVEYYGLRFGTVNGFSPNIRNDVMINAMTNSARKQKEVNISNPMVKRPILDIKDLCRAVECIINNGTFDVRGIYNLASFNSNVETIGRQVADILSAKVNFIDKNPCSTKDLNEKNIPKVYDFAISSNKFMSTFNFEFNGTIESITRDLNDNFEKAIYINPRNEKNILV
jgi:nucleoside-diphosphate-sugar epimerase